MSEQKNGYEGPIPTNPPAAQSSGAKTVESAIDTFTFPVASTVLNGLLVSQQHFPGALVLVGIAKAFGTVLGNCTAVGDLVPQMKLRKEIRDAFDKALGAQAPRPAPPANPGQQQRAVR